MRTQKASLAGLACYFETPAQESPTTCHAQTARINPPPNLNFTLNLADENNGMPSLVRLGVSPIWTEFAKLALFKQGLDDLAG